MDTQFTTIASRISPTLKRITHRLNGHFTFFDDDDLYQEALIHLWSSFEHGKLNDKTDSYILQGCYFHLKNYIRKTMDKANLVSLCRLMDDADTSLEEILPTKGSCELEGVEEKILMEETGKAGLTSREKRTLRFCLEGLTMREIGERLGVSHVMVLKIRDGIKSKCAGLKKDLGYQDR